ncbi:MAG TPA: cytochrome c [Terriglobales bacterium]|jgi:mono/diheme cytochrome c family protein|nr:cytochrome c [Terriglobales bacterium]
MITGLKLTSISLALFALLLLTTGCSQSGAASSDAGHGHELYQLHCQECHEGANLNLRKQPPKLNGMMQGKNLPSGAPATDEQVRKTIIEGRGIMPAFDQRLTDKEIDDLVKYLHTI